MESDLRKGKFTMAQIYKATKNFDPSFRLGQGGFGTVYRGTLDDGTLVAVKRAKRVRWRIKYLSMLFGWTGNIYNGV